MSVQDYLPKRMGDKATWAKNMKTKLPGHNAALALDAQKVALITEACNNMVNAVDASEQAQATAKQVVADSRTTIRNSTTTLRSEIRAIKTNDAYTEGMGKDLLIIGPDDDDDYDDYKPEISARSAIGHVVIEFKKKGIDGVNVYSRKKGDTQWQKLGSDYHSPYTDTKPLTVPGVAESREYMCRGIVADEEVGVDSDIVTALFADDVA